MSTPHYPSVELIQRSAVSAPGVPPRRRRWKVFFGVLIVALAVALAIVYARTPIYRASASVLTVKPKAADMPSAAADIQHVAIQERLLLGEEMLDRLSLRLKGLGDEPVADHNALRSVLSVATVAETNLLELRAQGEEPGLLQRIVNEWAKSFQTFRLEQIKAAAGRTSAELKDEQRQLQEKIVAARSELLAFREAHDIVSLKRDENRKISALNGVNKSLNKATERLIEARARKAAIDGAIARGETVVPNEQKAAVARMRVEAARASAKLSELRQKYTDVYLERDPAFRDLPSSVEEKQQELSATLEVAKATVRDEAQQAVSAARASVEALKERLDSDQKQVQLFTERFRQFKMREEDLARLERLSAERGERLAQIEVRNQEKFPPIQVVDWARLPERPIHPDYDRDLAIALAAALGLALFVTWLVEYLGGRSHEAFVPPSLDVRISHGNSDGLLVSANTVREQLHSDAVVAGRLPHEQAPMTATPKLEAGYARELSATEIEALLPRLDRLSGAHAILLLRGVAPHELLLLTPESFDRQTQRISISGENEREFVLDTASWQRIKPLLATTPDAFPASIPEIDGRLANAAREAGLAEPHTVTALALWHRGMTTS